MVQLTSDSFPSGSFFLHHHEWILDFREVRFDPHQKSWTSLKCSRNRSAEDHMVSKNHLRNMVKENDTWQFSNWPFLISKSPTRSSPHEDSDWQPVHGGSVGTAPPTSFSCLCYRLENFLLLEINLLRKKKKMYLRHLSLSFHQISCWRSVGGRACAGGEVIKLWVWGNVRHSQTTLMPCVVICQNEL